MYAPTTERVKQDTKEIDELYYIRNYPILPPLLPGLEYPSHGFSIPGGGPRGVQNGQSGKFAMLATHFRGAILRFRANSEIRIWRKKIARAKI